MTPAQEFYDAYITDRPRNIGVGAVLLTLVVAVFVLALDAISSRHLKSVIVAAVRQHEAKTERVWAVMNQLAYNSTIASQVSDPAWAIVGGLDVLRSTDLSDLQQRVVVRALLPQRQPAAPHREPGRAVSRGRRVSIPVACGADEPRPPPRTRPAPAG